MAAHPSPEVGFGQMACLLQPGVWIVLLLLLLLLFAPSRKKKTEVVARKRGDSQKICPSQKEQDGLLCLGGWPDFSSSDEGRAQRMGWGGVLAIESSVRISPHPGKRRQASQQGGGAIVYIIDCNAQFSCPDPPQLLGRKPH